MRLLTVKLLSVALPSASPYWNDNGILSYSAFRALRDVILRALLCLQMKLLFLQFVSTHVGVSFF